MKLQNLYEKRLLGTEHYIELDFHSFKAWKFIEFGVEADYVEIRKRDKYIHWYWFKCILADPHECVSSTEYLWPYLLKSTQKKKEWCSSSYQQHMI